MIPDALRTFLTLDFAPLLAVTLAAGTLGLLGSFLVLERRAMIGDAMAHSVLPGLVAGFLITGSRAPFPMFVGALAAAGLASAAISFITRYGRIDPSTAIGVVFTSLFALGILGVEASGARNVDLDLDCVLSGQLELLYWRPPSTYAELLSPATVLTLPREVLILGALAVLTPLLLALVWKPLTAATFDRTYATTRGLRPTLVRSAVFALTTVTIVASFEALGSILVVALLTCPAAAARLRGGRLAGFVCMSALFGAASGVFGYLGATQLAPTVIGGSIDASGTVASLSGLILAVMALRHRSRSAE